MQRGHRTFRPTIRRTDIHVSARLQRLLTDASSSLMASDIVLGPRLSLRTKFPSLVLASALGLILAKSLVFMLHRNFAMTYDNVYVIVTDYTKGNVFCSSVLLCRI